MIRFERPLPLNPFSIYSLFTAEPCPQRPWPHSNTAINLNPHPNHLLSYIKMVHDECTYRQILLTTCTHLYHLLSDWRNNARITIFSINAFRIPPIPLLVYMYLAWCVPNWVNQINIWQTGIFARVYKGFQEFCSVRFYKECCNGNVFVIVS